MATGQAAAGQARRTNGNGIGNGTASAVVASSNDAVQGTSPSVPTLSLDDAASGISGKSSINREDPRYTNSDTFKQRIKDVGSRSPITDFHVSLEERPRTYYQPGESVRGTVILELAAPAKSLYVQLKLVGSVHVSMSRGRVSHVFFEDDILLWGTQGTQLSLTTPSQKDNWMVGTMDAGEHVFDFEFSLPAASIPSSIEVKPTDVLIRAN